MNITELAQHVRDLAIAGSGYSIVVWRNDDGKYFTSEMPFPEGVMRNPDGTPWGAHLVHFRAEVAIVFRVSEVFADCDIADTAAMLLDTFNEHGVLVEEAFKSAMETNAENLALDQATLAYLNRNRPKDAIAGEITS